MKRLIILTSMAILSTSAFAQKVTKYTTTEGNEWQKSAASLSSRAKVQPAVIVNGDEEGTTFRAWGTTFNELDWEAYGLLPKEKQDEIMHNIFGADGDLHFTHGRISMNANDYALAWYSCDDVVGDLGLRYFNIDHDKTTIIPLAKDAQKYCPELQLFMSPWSPPAWMKINQDYPVQPSQYNTMDKRQAYLVYMDDGKELDEDEVKLLGDREGVFPRHLAMQDFFIQDPRYLQSYADMFCRFIELYAEEGLPITKAMYQNEAYSYTVYPGCAWTAEGTLRFNNEYLAPTLAKKHPEVELWIGTFNTNRLDYVEKILDDKTLQANAKGVGTQWECRYNLPELRKRYPNFRFMCSESECGDGSMDWAAGEHTFLLLADNLGNGCDEYYNWNFILQDNGRSKWGWNQNALIQVDSKAKTARYTAEYYAYKHFSHFIAPGSKMLGYAGGTQSDSPIVVFKTETGYAVAAGNFTDKTINSSVGLSINGKMRYLNIVAAPHSFNTYVVE